MLKSIKSITALFLICMLLISISGCGKTDNSKKQVEVKEERAKTIVMARPVDSNNLDYVTQDGNINIWMFNLILEGLVKSSDDGKKVEPNLAETWDVSSDQMTYTFHLKKGIKFSDGTLVKGEDWVFSLKRARDTKDSLWAFSLTAIKDITTPDDNTVVITLNQPWAPIMADLAMFNASVTSKSYFEKVGEKGFSQKPIGTGPYAVTEWKKGEYILFNKNPNYWRPGLPKTDQIKVAVVPDDNTRIMQLQAGDADMITFLPFNRITELQKDSKLTAITLPSTETRYIQMNTTMKPLNDVKVRQALDLATDKQALMKTILYGFGEPAKSFMAKAGMNWNEGLQTNPYDVEKAKKLLGEAGYVNGVDLTITVPSGNTVNESVATMLKEQWSKVGVKLNIETLEAGLADNKLTTMKSQMQLMIWTNDIVDPSEQVDYACIFDNSSNFYTGWKNDEVDKLSKDAEKEIDVEKRKVLYYKIQELYQKDMPMITLFHVPFPVAMKKNIKGFVQTPLGNYNFENLEKVGK